MTERRKRLIEVAFPLKEVSAHSRREKNIRHGHISTLHIWWARRPLAACRAFIYASLVDDPDTDAERDALLREVADLANWDAVRHPDRVVRNPEDGGSGLTGTELLKRARERILACNDGKPPKLLDPFAGGGAIPLEGLRLGCEVEASDLNPVAVLILKGTLEYWLARKPKKRVALEPVIDSETGTVDFRVVEGEDVTGTPGQATTSRGDTRCLLCGQIVKAAQVHDIGRQGEMSARMTAVVLQPSGKGGKRYRSPNTGDMDAFCAAQRQATTLGSQTLFDLPAVPDEPLAYHPQYMLVREYGLDEWGKLFNQRQLLALVTFARLIGDAHSAMQAASLDDDYAAAICTYLGVAVDRQATRTSTGSFWDAGGETLQQIFARQALPMVWDYAESAPLEESSGGFSSNLDTLVGAIRQQSFESVPAVALKRDARAQVTSQHDCVVTDPPYYDSINYADLSDFFYVWAKRSIGFLHPELFALPLTPKREQIVMNRYLSHTDNGVQPDVDARQGYVDGMRQAFDAMAGNVKTPGLAGVVFAHTDPDAWATLIEGLLQAGLIPDATWPIDTEIPSGLKTVGQARLKTSVWMACRKRDGEAVDTFLGDVLVEMQPVIRERLLYFWGEGIRGADFFISAIGPALSVFGRHLRVLNPDGSEVSVRDFLDIVRRESTAVALEQVLQGADLGMVDSITQQYVTWVWSYSRAALDAGEALALCLATGTRLDDVTRDHSIAVTARQRSKKVVKLRTIAERAREDDDLGGESSGRTAPLIDQLQCAAWLWGQNQSDRLGKYREALGESRWQALLTLGQAVASCLPEGDEDRRVILGLLGATVRATEAPAPSPQLSLGMDKGDGTE